ncbi:MAG: alpha-L-fucosidase [Acidobacteriota bacterium]
MRKGKPIVRLSGPRAVAVVLVCVVVCQDGHRRYQAAPRGEFEVTENDSEIQISSSALEVVIRKEGYVSGVYRGTFLDKQSGFRDVGSGLDIVDWTMEPGSDEAYRDKLDPDLIYEFDNLFHGKIPKKSIEGPQICTQAKKVSSQVTRGKDFVSVRTSFQYYLAAPGKKPGSVWTQNIVFPAGKRYFISSDMITTVNASDAMFQRIDMPGHIKHNRGDTFSEVYLSYLGKISSSEFFSDFPPDERFIYRRGAGPLPQRFIRAYRLRDPKTGREGPWLAGMTLDPAVVYEAWCHQRGYVCMIQEFGGTPVKPGDSFSAAFIVGFFDSIEEMNQVYDKYAGHTGLRVDEKGWRLLRSSQKSSSSSTGEKSAEDRLADRLEWFKDQKFGLLVHWGPYSQWGCIESWPLVEVEKWARPEDLRPWVERSKNMESFRRDYWSLSRTFNPTRFDPVKWASAAKQAGMKYLVFTTKHHDGFSMFDTKLTDYRITAPDCPYSKNPRPDIALELFKAFRAEGLGIGVYFSKADWHHPDYWSTEVPALTRNPNYDPLKNPEKWGRFVKFVQGQIKELMTGYGPIDILWLDAGQVRPPKQDLQMDRVVAMARKHQPDLIVVDRAVASKHQDYLTPEQQVPDKPLLDHAWETCETMGTQWSYKQEDRYKSSCELIHMLVNIVAKGGNLLLNIGPQPDGELPAVAVERLNEIGDWMRVNGEAIYATRPIAPYKNGQVAITRRDSDIYLIYLDDPKKHTLPAEVIIPSVHLPNDASIYLLGFKEPLKWRKGNGGLIIEIPGALTQALPSRHAFVLKTASVNSVTAD